MPKAVNASKLSTNCGPSQSPNSPHYSTIYPALTSTGAASLALMTSNVCPVLVIWPHGSRGLVSMELQSTCSEAALFCTLRATLCQCRSSRDSTPSPLNTHPTDGSSALETPGPRRASVRSGPFKSSDSCSRERDWTLMDKTHKGQKKKNREPYFLGFISTFVMTPTELQQRKSVLAH